MLAIRGEGKQCMQCKHYDDQTQRVNSVWSHEVQSSELKWDDTIVVIVLNHVILNLSSGALFEKLNLMRKGCPV